MCRMPFGWHQAHFGVPPFLGLVFSFNLHTQLLLVKTDQRGTSLFLQVHSAILSLKSNENTQEFPTPLVSWDVFKPSPPLCSGQITAFELYFQI